MNMHLMSMMLKATAPARKRNLDRISPAISNGVSKMQEKLDGMFGPNKKKEDERTDK